MPAIGKSITEVLEFDGKADGQWSDFVSATPGYNVKQVCPS